ncbi:MAG: NAD(P)H-hydrate dehydratase [Proteobacteria bacterium]|nr:NAD(P)H-hydrate dehydratase [Pseudomonadota bacterium]
MKNFTKSVQKLLSRKADSNKGNFGHVLVIGGDVGMGGAIIMAAEAAYRTGAGKVTVLTKEENIASLLARLPNAMTLLPSASKEEIFANKTVIVIGCGLGKSDWAQKLFAMAMASNLPKIIDADALNILSVCKKNFVLSNAVITPHVGEAARLLNVSSDEIQKNRELSVKKLYEKFKAIAVLKGSGTLIFGDKKIIHQCPYGNAGMATAGMGDVLSGVIGGLISQHLDKETAAIFGVNIHALAADLVAKKQGEVGMMPSDLFKYIPHIINDQI